MRRRRIALGLLPILPASALVLPGACARPPASIGLVMRSPEALLDQATSVALYVFPAEQATCEATGHVSRIPPGDGTQRFALDKGGCPAGVAWCKDIKLDQDGSKKMFAVVASSAAGTLAEGCAVAAIDQDPLEVTIRVQRYNPPPCCNDGVLQAGEQCDSGEQAGMACDGRPGRRCGGVPADAVCGCDCRSKEILLSIDDTDPPLVKNGPPRSKSQLSMAFTPGNPKIAGALRAVYRTETPNVTRKVDVGIRFLSKDLYPIDDPEPLSQQLLLPLACDDVRGGGLAQVQESPSIATIGAELTGIAYASDEMVPNSFDVWLVAHTMDGCRDKCSPGDPGCPAALTPVMLSVPAPAPGSVDPDLAGGPGRAALATWTRNGRVLGRIWKATGELVPASGEIDVAPSGSHARVAGSAKGWVVVYQGAGDGDADGIFMRAVDVNGAVGPEMRVNSLVDGAQDQPDVAALDDGRALVVWRSATDVYFQRYDASGRAVAGDQDAALNTHRDGEQAHPAAAGSVGFGELFAVAWEDIATGEIAARFVGGSAGFLFNSVTGQNDDFIASSPSVLGVRRLPAVAIGGGGHVAIGWQDDSDSHPGVYVRRFPLPTTR